MKVYLVGPISGCTYKEAAGWRSTVTKAIEFYGYSVFNPMTGKDHLKDEDKIILSYEDHLMSKGDHIFQADLHRVRHSDILFCNFQDLKGYTIGSFFELGYGYALNKAIIVVATDKMIVEHPFIKNSALVAPSIDTGVEILKKLVK